MQLISDRELEIIFTGLLWRYKQWNIPVAGIAGGVKGVVAQQRSFGRIPDTPTRLPGETMTKVVTGHLAWEDRYLLPLTAPGLGVCFNPDALEADPFQVTELPQLHREGGSFTNG